MNKLLLIFFGIFLGAGLTYIILNKENEGPPEVDYSLIGDTYKMGEVVIPATSINKNGIIRVFVDENKEDKELVGIIYEYSESLDVERFDTVYFGVSELNGIIVGTDVSKEVPEGRSLFETIIDEEDIYGLDLHLEENKYGKHNKIHIINYTLYPDDQDYYELTAERVKADDSKILIEDRMLVFKEQIDALDTSIYYYLIQTGVFDGLKVYDLKINHIHLLENSRGI